MNKIDDNKQAGFTDGDDFIPEADEIESDKPISKEKQPQDSTY